MSNDNVKTILLVEDEHITSSVCARTIKKFGYNVITVHSGEEAVERVSSDRTITLVLMDIDLGEGIDGTEAARRILVKRNIPIVFHTAHSEQEMVERVKGITRYGYVIKSSGDFVLNSSIEMALELFEANTNIENSMEAMKESEEKYRAAFMTIPDALSISAMDGEYIDINEGYTNLTGYRIEDVNGRLSTEINIWSNPDDRLRLVDAMKCFGYLENLEAVFRCKDGSLKTGLMSARVIMLKNKPHILSITRDISERRLIEQEKSKFSKIIENSLNEIYIFDPVTLKFRYANRGALKNLGYSLDEICEMTPLDIKYGFTKELFSEKIESLHRRDKEQEVFYALHKRKDGSTYPVEVFLQLICADNEKLFLAVINDITERKKTEDALSESEKRYRTLVEILPDGIAIHTGDVVVYANEAAHKIMHARYQGELIGMPVTDFVHPDYRELAKKRITDGITNKITGEPVEEIFLALDGANITVTVTSIPFTYFTKPALLIIFNDITGSKLAAQKIKSLLEEKELLLKEVHHRIKNNMNTIKGLLVLQSYALKEPLALAALQDAESRVQSMMVLYDKLYRTDTFVELSLKEYLPALIDEIALNYLIDKTVKIEKRIMDFSIDTKSLFPVGIIVNELITNAVKYAFHGRDSGLISVTASADGSKGLVTVEDNGIGLPESVDFENSAGFGLQLVKMLAEQIGGHIRIERGAGTKFILEFSI